MTRHPFLLFFSWIPWVLKFLQLFLHRNWRAGLSLALGALLTLAGWSLAPTVSLAADYNANSLIGADFSGQDLTDSSFTRTNLRGADLSRANLQGVSLFGANLAGANLEAADLRGATLDTARLTRANLTNALLEGAFAFNAKFDGATIDGADFTDVEFRQDQQAILCSLAKGTNPVTGRQTRETLNCP